MKLRDQLSEIMAYLQTFDEQEVYERTLNDIYEGQLLPYLEDSLREELEPEAYIRARQRIAPINLLQQITNKLAKTYMEPPERRCENSKDTELVEYYSKWMNLDNCLSRADKFLELHKYVTVEPYWRDGPKCMIVPADRHKYKGDDPLEVSRPTTWIKYMGTRKTYLEQTTYRDGKQVADADVSSREVAQYWIYTADEFIIVDAVQDGKSSEVNGKVRDDLMKEYGIVNDVNPYGMLPSIMVKKPTERLMPPPNTDDLQMAILIPKLLTDLNYAAQFNTHSIFYGIDVDVSSAKGNPDSLWTLTSLEGENKNPSIGTISPSVDIPGIMQQTETEVAMWLQSKGIRAGNNGQAYSSQPISGIAKMIDEGDATAARRERIEIWKDAEKDFWELIIYMHNNHWGQKEECPLKFNFTSDCEVEVVFKEPKAMLSEEDNLRNIKEKLSLGLMTQEMALRACYPDATDDMIFDIMYQTDALPKEVKQEAEAIEAERNSYEEEDDDTT